MQQDIRAKHSETMQETDAVKFHTLHKQGKLLKSEQPGNVMAKLVLDAPKALSGKFLR